MFTQRNRLNHEEAPSTSTRPAVPMAARRAAVRRSMATLAALIVASASASSLAVAAGGTSAAAATRPAVAASAVTWHKLALVNGWASSQGQWGTGGPAWTVHKGIVYLAGSAHLTSGSKSELAVLPPAARPAVALYLTVYTNDNTSGLVGIFPDGAVYASSNNPSDARNFTSLAGLSFPAAATARHRLTLLDGWKPGLTAWKSGPPAYTISGGIVRLSGALHLPGKGGGVFAILPKAARPAHNVYIPVRTYGFSVGDLLIYPDGLIEIYGAGGPGFTSLAGISYAQATTTRTALHLINGWQSGQARYSTGAPSYSLAGGVVQMSGSLTQPGGGTAQFAVLPARIRPAHNLYIQVETLGGVGTVEIEPNGTISAFNGTGAYAGGFTSLAGITYPLKS